MCLILPMMHCITGYLSQSYISHTQTGYTQQAYLSVYSNSDWKLNLSPTLGLILCNGPLDVDTDKRLHCSTGFCYIGMNRICSLGVFTNSYDMCFFGLYFTFSWLNLTRSLSQLKEDSRRRCSDLKSDPARSEVVCWAGMHIPCWDRCFLNTINWDGHNAPYLTFHTWVLVDGSSVFSFVLLRYFSLSFLLIL